jgi:hypothetical protein
MNELDDTTFARFAERFARIERKVPEPPPLSASAPANQRIFRRLAPMAGLAGVVILLAAVVGLAVIGVQPPASPSPAAVNIPPDSAPPEVVLEAYLRAVQARDCGTASQLTVPLVFGAGLCAATFDVTAFSVSGGPAVVDPYTVRLSVDLTITGNSDILAGDITWTCFLQEQSSGAWRIIDGYLSIPPSMHVWPSPGNPATEPTASGWTPGEPTTIRGRILDAHGNPVPQVKVQAFAGPVRGQFAGDAMTGAEGTWTITLPSGNTYCLLLGMSIPGPNGGAPTEFEAALGPSGIGDLAGASPCLDQGGDIVVDVALPAMTTVSGTVVDEAGHALTLTDAGGPFRKIDLTVASVSVGLRSSASADGRFSIWVPRGTWSVIAWAFRGEQAALSKAMALEVRADPIADLTIGVATSSQLTK